MRSKPKTDTFPAAESAAFLLRLVPPEAAFAHLLKNTRKANPFSAAESAEFLLRFGAAERAFALSSKKVS